MMLASCCCVRGCRARSSQQFQRVTCHHAVDAGEDSRFVNFRLYILLEGQNGFSLYTAKSRNSVPCI
eukprot:2244515-Rhodomonas_salina.2